jgi:hypothetical protein
MLAVQFLNVAMSAEERAEFDRREAARDGCLAYESLAAHGDGFLDALGPMAE